ncbi:hypothetical protein PQO03_01125 [Lentisphaera profundi]|uniref:Right handed beta helix domain-containing protein n=1 Tax=Lentisphaera profundi TaxID=1658616 RepID=A0ABY7VWX4_9BACT|nr:right-handed parallel beta-helix repeat-containing protein [Lentisphaera profundi]WDE96568.1 hypothetical protein PQO03_01125 [Lentisphaera profundi]
MNCKWYVLIGIGLVSSLSSCGEKLDKSQVLEQKNQQQSKVIELPSFSGKTYFVSVNGDDSQAGTLEQPLKSLSKLVAKLEPGDGVIIRGGRYRGLIDIKGLNGLESKPISFIAYPGEKVVFDGSVELQQSWQEDEKGIFRSQLDFDITQVFIEDEMCITARWPNASFEDDSVFDMESTWRHQGTESSFGEMVDARPKGLAESVNKQSLSQTGIDFTGAVAVLNINAWMSYAQKVASHEAGSDRFSYDTKSMVGNLNMLKNEKFFAHKKKLGHYYLEGLMALDAEKEWYFTPENKMLYLKPPEGKSPKDLMILGKVQDYNLQVKNSSHLDFKGIQFFASTLKFDECTNMTVDECHFLYPSFNKFVLGEFGKNKYTSIQNRLTSEMKPTNNRVLNSVFEYADGPALAMSGYRNLVENNLFHHIDFTCIGGGGGGTIEMGSGRHTTFRYNTVHTAGNSEGYRSGPSDVVEYNYLYDMSLLQHDGSAINCGVNAIKDVKVSHNWIHGLRSKAAIRFDSSSMFSAYVNWGEGGTVNHNVVWDSAGLKLKGDRHLVFNNLSFDAYAPGKTDIALPCVPLMGGYNRYSVVNNNIAGAINGHFAVGRGIPLFCKNENNIQSDPRLVLRDPDNLDFRPLSDDVLLKKSNSHSANIGPYGAQDKNYWIPGYKAEKSSMPVPPDQSKNVKNELDLMWRPARASESFDIYFSPDKSVIELADKQSQAFKVNQQENTFSLGEIDPLKTYYWRVDSYVDGEVRKGDIWSFGGVEERQKYNYNYPIKPVPLAKKITLPECIVKGDLSLDSKKKIEQLYKRFWWDENSNWYKTLKQEEAKLKLTDKKYALIQRRLEDFRKMEHGFMIEEASKVLDSKELGVLRACLANRVYSMK